MSLSNTETFAFTAVPDELVKRWESATVSTDSMTAEMPASEHRLSNVKFVELRIQFGKLDNLYKQSCNRIDDQNVDAIEAWRENRKLWSNIETAVEQTVTAYIKEVRKHALDKQLQTIEVPIKTSTMINNANQISSKAHTIKHPNAPRSVLPTELSIRTGVTPDESASVAMFNMAEIRSIINREMDKKRHKKKKKNNSSLSILEYAAGRGKKQ